MRAVLDTNVIISGLLSTDSPPGRVFDAWTADRYLLVTSEALLAELARVLNYPKISKLLHWDVERIAEFMDELRTDSSRVHIAQTGIRLAVIVEDPDDNRVLEAAAAAGADYIVTGDNDLLRIERFEAIAIVTPAAFLALLDAA